MLSSTLLPVALLALPAFSLPTTPRAASTEQWPITGLTTHFVSANSGLPGGTWPPNTKFNSTISFTVTFPSSASSKCSASWPQPDYPQDYVPCEDGSTEFQLSAPEGKTFSEGTFDLSVRRTVSDSSATTVYTSPATYITNNNFSDPASYLTCLGGAPLTGTTCTQGGQMSVRTPLVLTATAEA